MNKLTLSGLKSILEKNPYYTKQNLGLALEKSDSNLNYWINKLIKQKILIPLKKGFYISQFYIDKVKNEKKYDEFLLKTANQIRQPSYISLETALSYYQIIAEQTFNTSSVTIKSTRKYESDLGIFTYKNIKKDLFTGYKKINNIYIGTKSKALFDYLYLQKAKNPNQVNYLLENKLRINWNNFYQNDIKEFAKYIRLSGSKKMQVYKNIINKPV